jgi:sulfur carrier protein
MAMIGADAGTRMEASTNVRVIVNGEATDTAARTLAELIASLGFAEGSVATARNGDFVPRGARANTCLGAGDKIEIVAPRQGG